MNRSDLQNQHRGKLGIYILSYDRPQQLAKIASFYLSYGFMVRIVYDSEIEINLSHENLKILHSKGSFASRARLLSEMVDTEFAILAPDDDVFVPSSLKTMVSFLRESDYKSVSGQAVGAWTKRQSPEICPIYLNFETQDTLNLKEQERLNLNLGNRDINPISMYKMMNGKLFYELLRLFGELDKFRTPYIYEISGEIFINYHGTTKRLNILYWLRSWNEPSIDLPKWERKILFANWWQDEEYCVERKEWVKVILNFCPDLSTNVLVQTLDKRTDPITKTSSFELFLPLRRLARIYKDWFKHNVVGYYKWKRVLKTLSWQYDSNEIWNCLCCLKIS